MKRFLSQTLDIVSLQMRLGNPQLAWKIHEHQGLRGDFCRSNGSVVLKDTGLTVNALNAPLLARAGSMMRSLSIAAGAKWKSLPASAFEARINGLSFHINTWEDIFILQEVFETGAYSLTHPSPAIVIDVGANIGISALFFASKPWVKHVYAFEPLKPTADLARANIARNPQLQPKVTLCEHGLGGKDEETLVEYSPEWKGHVGRHGIPDSLRKTVQPWNENVTLKDASRTLSSILDTTGTHSVVVKMDCEGSEWEILPNLAASGVLKKIDQLVLEWHERTPEPLEDLLTANGFTLVRRDIQCRVPLGLLYATRVRNLP